MHSSSLLQYLVTFLSLLPLPGMAVQYVSNSSLLTNLTTECSGALMADIGCDPFIRRMRPGQYYAQADLSRTCSSNCEDALGAFHAGVVSSCKGQMYNASETALLPVTFITDLLRYLYNKACIMDAGRFCNVLAFQAARAQGQQAPLSKTAHQCFKVLLPVTLISVAYADGGVNNGSTVDPCDDCFIKNLQFEASSPFYDGPNLGPVYSSKTSSCGKTTFPLSTSTFEFDMLVDLSPPSRIYTQIVS